MKTVRLSLLLVCLTLPIIISSCNDNPVVNDKVSIWELFNQSPSSTKYGFLYSTKTTYINSPSNFTTHQSHYAYFYDSLSNYRPADNVTLNGNVISQKNDTDNVVFDGIQEHIWEVIGNQFIPSYLDSILSINTFAITTPLPGIDTIFKNNGVNFQYSTIHGIDSVIVYAKLNKALSSSIDTSYWRMSDIPQGALVVSNTGSITLTPSFFESFPANSYITVEIIALRSKEKVINNRPYLTVCVVSSRADYLLK